MAAGERRVPVIRQPSPVFAFGDFSMEEARALQRRTTSQRDDAMPGGDRFVIQPAAPETPPLSAAVSAASRDGFAPAYSKPAARSLVDVMAEEASGFGGCSQPRSPYLQAATRRIDVSRTSGGGKSRGSALVSSGPAMYARPTALALTAISVGTFSPVHAPASSSHTHARRHVSGEASESDGGSASRHSNTAIEHESAQPELRRGPTGRDVRPYVSSDKLPVSARPTYLSSSVHHASPSPDALPQAAPATAKWSVTEGVPPPRPPLLLRHSSSIDSVFLLPAAGTLLRALSALSDGSHLEDGRSSGEASSGSPTPVSGAGTMPMPPSLTLQRAISREESSMGGVARVNARVHTRVPKKSSVAASLVKLSRLYSIAMAVSGDIQVTAALERGPPYATPVFVRNTFTPVLKPHTMDRLRQGLVHTAKQVLEEPNAGGNSENSEAISVEILAACQGLKLWASEMAIAYQAGSPLIDFIAVKALDVKRDESLFVSSASASTPMHPPGATAPATTATSGRHSRSSSFSVPATALAPSDRRKHTLHHTLKPSSMRPGQHHAGVGSSWGRASELTHHGAHLAGQHLQESHSSSHSSSGVAGASVSTGRCEATPVPGSPVHSALHGSLRLVSIPIPVATGKDAPTIVHHADSAAAAADRVAPACECSGASAASIGHTSGVSAKVADASDREVYFGTLAPVLPNEVLVGVSVTRAMKFKGGPQAFTAADAERLLTKKLRGFQGARDGVADSQRWSRQILHVFAESSHVADQLERTVRDPLLVPPALWADTILFVTIAPPETMHRIIFRNEADFNVPIAYKAGRHAEQVARLRSDAELPWATLDGHSRAPLSRGRARGSGTGTAATSKSAV